MCSYHRGGRCKRGHRGGKPSGVGILVIHIAIRAWRDAFPAHLLKARIELFPDLAEFLIRGIAQPADGKTQAVQLQIGCHKFFVETDCRFGSLAIAPGGDDHQQILLLCEVGGRDVGHVFHHGLETPFLRILHCAIRQGLGVTTFGAIKNREFPGGNRCGGTNGCGGTGSKKSA